MIELFTFDTDSVENTDLDAGENISHTLNLPDDANKQTCRWISSGEIVEIHGIKLTRGNFYVGEYFCLPPKSYLDNLGINKECKGTHIYGPVINPKLSINNGNISKQSFSTYNDMPSTWRYECVMWLSGEKCCTEIPIELLMFYLFGWEIRMFVDPQTPCSERKAMVKELIKFHRILAIEFSNPEYNGDGIHWLRELSDFIASAIIKFFSDNIYEFDTDGILSHSRLYANFYIGRLIEDDLFSTKGFDVACKVYDKHISFPSSCRSLAEKYFLGYFNKKRKNITANIDKNYKEKKSISYYSNYWKSNSSHSYFSYQMAIPYLCVDVLWGGIQAVRDKFWNYAHYKRWSSGGKDTIAALFSLPKEVNIQEIPEIIALTSTLDKEMLTTSYMIKPFNWLLELCEYRLYGDNNISLAEAHSLIDSLNRIGFGIVPNCKVGQNKLWHKADCLIYRNEGGYPVSKTIKLEKSDLFIKLATKIVNMDVPTNDDIILVEKYIQSHKNTIGNYRHLVASIRWLFFCKKRIILDNDIKQTIARLTSQERISMGEKLIELAHIGGYIHPKRVEGLKKVVLLLGLDASNIHSQIHRSLTGGDSFAVIEKQSGAAEYKITKENEKSAARPVKEVLLNKKKLSAIEKETQQAQSMLSTVFEDDVQENITQTSLANNAILDILRELLSKEIWERQDIEKMCSSKGLMLGAVMEQINDYAYEKVGDVLVEEDGDTIYVAIDYKNELI